MTFYYKKKKSLPHNKMEIVYSKRQTALVIAVVVVTVILVFTMNGKTKAIDTGNTPEDDDDNNDDDATETNTSEDNDDDATETNTSEGENDDTNANRTDEKKSNRNYYWLLLLFLIPIGVFILIISYRKRKTSLQHKTTFEQNLNNDDKLQFQKRILNLRKFDALKKDPNDIIRKARQYKKKYGIQNLHKIPIPKNEVDKIIHQLAIDYHIAPIVG